MTVVSKRNKTEKIIGKITRTHELVQGKRNWNSWRTNMKSERPSEIGSREMRWIERINMTVKQTRVIWRRMTGRSH